MEKRSVMLYVGATVVVAIAGAAVAMQPLIAALVICAAGLLAVLARTDWWQRAYGLTLVLMMGATSTIAPLVTVAEYGRYAAAAALLAVTWLTTRGIAPVISGKLHQRALGALWLTVALAAASVLWSVDRIRSGLQVVALVMLVSLIHVLSTRRWTDRDRMLKDLKVGFYVLTGAFIACIAAPFLGIPETRAFGGSEDTVGRFQGLFNNPNMLALLSAITIPLGWGHFRERPTVFRFVSVLPAVVTTFMAESRTAIIAAAAAMLWVVLRSGAKTIARALYVLGLTAGIALVSNLNPLGTALDRFGKIEGGDILNTRGTAWEAAIRLVIEQPIGYGWQAGRSLFESLQGASDFEFSRTSVHNSYLQSLLELGFISLLPLAYLTFTMVVLAFRGSSRGMGAGLAGVIAAGLIVQVTESAMFGTGQAYPYIVWFAVAGGLASYKPRPGKHQHLSALAVNHGEPPRAPRLEGPANGG
ncbi:O-antigen ligase [Arthrobacter sp. W4I7]|uniref:O-antigen ligase family protein n=1 Tax=Arthrobacter sp. W4I7 TaxID=3042296 RepID=UPI002787D0C4|nr:O-antigen ligase family protein [Arthrobacter sp. W4I7]MDQ0689864.1 exopolysaccharide production protein ExoQ [Arthrobacter sp. W4I7]